MSQERTTIRIAITVEPIDPAPEWIAVGNLTEREVGTLESRIRMYIGQCNRRAYVEGQKLAESRAESATKCRMCNDTKEVRAKEWSVRYKKWVYVEGTEPCPLCGVTCDDAPENAEVPCGS